MQKQSNRVSRIADIDGLNNRITLMKEKYVGKNPNIGMSMYKNVRLGNAQAKVFSLRSQEYHTAVTAKPEEQLSFIIRYRPDADEDTNIWFEGRGYDIDFIDDVKYGHELMELKAEHERGITPEN